MAECGGTSKLDVNNIGRRVTAIYEPVVENLTQVRVLARSFEQEIERLDASQTEPSETERDNSAEQAADALGALCSLIATSIDAISAEQIDEDLRHLELKCRQLKNNGRELSALSSLMLITAANASDDFAVDSLVEELRDLSASLVKECDSIASVAVEVNAVRKTSVVSLEDALGLTDQHLQSMRNPAQASEGSRNRTTGESRRLGDMAASLSGSIATIMPRIMACMQYPDAFAQRCDHVAQILEIRDGEEVSATDRYALADLAQSLMLDMRHELDGVQQDTCSALREVAEACDDTILAFEDALRADTRLAQMGQRQDRLQTTRKSIQDIKAETDEALEDLETCQSVFEKISSAFERLNRMRVAVSLSSMNADLSERQSERNTPEIRSVTKAVGDCATSTGYSIEALNQSFDTLRQAFAKTGREQLGDALFEIGSRLDAASGEIEKLSEEVESLRNVQKSCARTLQELVSSARLAESQIAANSLTLKELEQMEGVLECADPGMAETARVDDKAMMKTIYDRYTMEREREVHREVLGRPDDDAVDAGSSFEEPDVGDDDDPLAAVLF